MGELTYKSRSDSYHFKHTVKFKNTLMYKLSGFILSLTLFVLFFLVAFSFNTVVDTLHYTEIGNADYSVKLLPNDKYGEITMSSGSDKAFVSSIVDKINPQFNYELHSDKSMIVKYKYTISSTLYYINYTDGKELKRDYSVLDEYESMEDVRDFNLRKSAEIDFQQYQETIKSYKQEFQIPIRSKLVVTMNLSILAVADNYGDPVTKNITETVVIPVGELTTDINIETPSFKRDDKVERFEKIAIKNIFYAFIDVIFFMSTVYFFILVVKKIYVLYTKKDVYALTLNKILSNYDSVIVSGKMEINEDNYDNIIYPSKFEEMVDASMNESSPILFYEVIPNELSLFIIIKGDILYKYIVSRSELEGEK